MARRARKPATMERRRAKRPEVVDTSIGKRGRPSFTGFGSMKGVSVRLPESTLELLDAWMQERKSLYFKKNKKTGLINPKGDRSAAMRDIIEYKLKRDGYG